MTSVYSGALSPSSLVFDRPDGNKDDSYCFQAIQITAVTPGTYVFTSSSTIDTMGYFYRTSFDPSNPLANLITDDDDSGDSFQFRIQAYLRSASTYILVVTTHWGSVTGNFMITAIGPASVNLMSITPSTSRPIVTREFFIDAFPIIETYFRSTVVL